MRDAEELNGRQQPHGSVLGARWRLMATGVVPLCVGLERQSGCGAQSSVETFGLMCVREHLRSL